MKLNVKKLQKGNIIKYQNPAQPISYQFYQGQYNPELKKKIDDRAALVEKQKLQEQMARSQGTLTDLGGKPSTDTRTSAQRNADYLHPIKGIVSRQKSEWDNGKHPVQGLAKTVGASALIAAGAGYSSPIVNTFAGLGKNIVAGGLGAEGFAMLDGRLATPTELTTGAAMEMGFPMIFKGSSQLYGKMFNNKTTAPTVQKVVQEVAPIAKKESIYQPATPFKIEKPTTNTLQLKSTMMGSPLEKQLSKDGMLSINSLQAHLNNPSTSIADRTMIRKVLDERFAGQPKINYNDFRKAVSDEMIPLEKNFDSNYADYGVKSIGYKFDKHINIENLDNVKNEIKKEQLINLVSPTTYRSNLIESYKQLVKEIEKEIKVRPKVNTSIVYSNKDKFGRGSTDHFQNEGTLGHSRILVSKEEPDIMHILEQQSDAYQKGIPSNRAIEIQMNNTKLKERYLQRLDNLEYSANKDTELAKKMRYLHENNLPDDNGNIVHKSTVEQFESMANLKLNNIKLNRGDISNPIQKELLGKTHQERLLQENVAHAGQNGQTKMRYPTPETAAKIQGYQQQINPELNSLYTKEDNLSRQINFNRANGYDIPQTDIDELESLRKIIGERKNEPMIYSKEHQTILKKYNDNPKMVKKVLGQDTKTVTDGKGNTWFEFDIPEAFRKGKAEIKALSTIGAVVTGKNIIDNKTKYAYGGNMKKRYALNYLNIMSK